MTQIRHLRIIKCRQGLATDEGHGTVMAASVVITGTYLAQELAETY